MRDYIIRRLMLMIPTILLVSIVVFFMIRFIPGSVVELMAFQRVQGSAASKESAIDEDAIRHMLGLDQPVHIQYIGRIWTKQSPGPKSPHFPGPPISRNASAKS